MPLNQTLHSQIEAFQVQVNRFNPYIPMIPYIPELEGCISANPVGLLYISSREGEIALARIGLNKRQRGQSYLRVCWSSFTLYNSCTGGRCGSLKKITQGNFYLKHGAYTSKKLGGQ